MTMLKVLDPNIHQVRTDGDSDDEYGSSKRLGLDGLEPTIELKKFGQRKLNNGLKSNLI